MKTNWEKYLQAVAYKCLKQAVLCALLGLYAKKNCEFKQR